MKICKLCGKEKEECEFGKCNKTKSGLTARCKKCINEISKISKNKKREEYLRKAREYAKREYDKNPDKFRNRHKKWIEDNFEKYRESDRKSSKKKYENNKSIYNEQAKKWKKANPERTKELARKQRKLTTIRYPDRERARMLFSLAIRKGEIVRPTTCSRCKEEGNIEGHHYDYSKPLDVIWLCKKCHAEEHKN